MTKPKNSARQIATDVAAGRTSAVETAKAALARIDVVDLKLVQQI
jgi:aspartyl-tRNA(Asn)/glutamyl-tRNA(Gln) amidotransferase subunit A